MFVLIRTKYPPNKFSEATAMWNKQPKPAPYAKSLGTFNRVDLNNGWETYTIVEVQDDKYSEWFQAAAKALFPFMSIEGYELQIDVVSKSATPTGK
jgi:hypothetical protein